MEARLLVGPALREPPLTLSLSRTPLHRDRCSQVYPRGESQRSQTFWLGILTKTMLLAQWYRTSYQTSYPTFPLSIQNKNIFGLQM